jgi:hypothetical protein
MKPDRIASVESINDVFQGMITLKDRTEARETVMVENPEPLEHTNVGDKTVITQNQALAFSLDKEN